MGRHSAPDDADAGLDERPTDAAPATSVATVPQGRHTREDSSRPRPTPEAEDDGPTTGGLDLLEQVFDAPAATPPDPPEHTSRPADADEPTAKIAPITDATEPPASTLSAPPPALAPADRAGSDVRGAHATRHDLALVMSHGDVRSRVLAAVLGPFVVYVAVLAIVGKLIVHSLIWVWAPAIVAGVLVGLVLDAGHRHYPAPGERAAADEVASSS